MTTGNVSNDASIVMDGGARNLISILGPVTVSLVNEKIEARLIGGGDWSFETWFPNLPPSTRVVDGYITTVRNNFYSLRLNDPVFNPLSGSLPSVDFSANVSEQALYDIAPFLADLTGRSPSSTLVPVFGTIIPEKNRCATIMLRTSKAFVKDTVLSEPLTFKDITLFLSSEGDAERGGTGRLELCGRLGSSKRPDQDLGFVSASLSAGQWRFSFAEDLSSFQTLSLAEIVDLFPVLSTRGNDRQNLIQLIEKGLNTAGAPGTKSLSEGAVELNKILDKAYLHRMDVTATQVGETWTVHAVRVKVGARAAVNARLYAGTPELYIGAPWLSFDYHRLLGLGGVRVQIGGKLWIGGGPAVPTALIADLSAEIDLSQKLFELKAVLNQDDQKRNTLYNIISVFGETPSDQLKSLTLTDFQLGGEIAWGDGGGFGVFAQAACEGSLELPLKGLVLRSGRVRLARRPQGAISAALEVEFRWEDTVTFLLAAHYQTGALTLKGGLVVSPDDKPLSVKALIDTFKTGWQVPDPLANVQILQLGASVTVGKESHWSFDAGIRWITPLAAAGRPVVIDASIALTGEGTKAGSGRLNGRLNVDKLIFDLTYTFAADHSKELSLTFNVGTVTFIGKWNIGGNKITLSASRIEMRPLIEGLLKLIDEKATFVLPSPWNALGNIAFDKPAMEIDLAGRTVSLATNVDLSLPGFDIKISRITLIYGRKGGKDGLWIAVDAAVLGNTYSVAKGNALSWNAADPKPPLPPATGKVLDLRYFGIGQHIALPALGGKSAEADVDAVKRALAPPKEKDGKLPAIPDGLKFDPASAFLLAADFTVKDTLTLATLYRHPDYFGLAITLRGKRAGLLDGLSMELRYRRIGDVQMFGATFLVPQKFRNISLGAVGLTLGTVSLEIYTNSDFHVDLGFPVGGNFSRSFVVQTPTLTGRGGFYLTKKTGTVAAAASPPHKSGSFSPILAGGVGLSVGVIRKVQWGPAAGEVALAIGVILEGTCAWWVDPLGNQTDEKYYKFIGIAQIGALIDVKIDLEIICVALSAEASARTMLTMEAGEPTVIEATFHIATHAEIRASFFTISKSFEMDGRVETSFGTKTIPIWNREWNGPVVAAPVHPEAPKQVSSGKPPSPVVVRRRLDVHPCLIPSLAESGGANNHVVVFILGLDMDGEFGFRALVGGMFEMAIKLFQLEPVTQKGVLATVNALSDCLFSDAAKQKFTDSLVAKEFTEIFDLIFMPTFTLDQPLPWSQCSDDIKKKFKYESDYNSNNKIEAQKKIAEEKKNRKNLAIMALPPMILNMGHQKLTCDGAVRDSIFRDTNLLLLRSALQIIQKNIIRLEKSNAKGQNNVLAALVEILDETKPSNGSNTGLQHVAGVLASTVMSGSQKNKKSLTDITNQQKFIDEIITGMGYDIYQNYSVEINAPKGFRYYFRKYNSIYGISDNVLYFNRYYYALNNILSKTVSLDYSISPLPARQRHTMLWTLPFRRGWDERHGEDGGPKLGPAPKEAEKVYFRPLPFALLGVLDRIANYPIVVCKASGGGALADVRCATLIPLEVEQTKNPETLLLRGADGAERHRLLRLWQDLKDPLTAPLTVTLLYPESADKQARLISDRLDRDATRVIQWSLSNLTVPDSVPDEAGIYEDFQPDTAPEANLISASLRRSAGFVRLIWEASVADGDCTLKWKRYDQTGYPVELFAPGVTTATIWLLAIARHGDRAYPRLHTNALCVSELPADDTPLIVESISPVAPDSSLPVLQAGEFGVVVHRDNPCAKQQDCLNDSARTQAMFSIVQGTVKLPGIVGQICKGPLSPVTSVTVVNAATPNGRTFADTTAGTWSYAIKVSPGEWNIPSGVGELDDKRSPYRFIAEKLTPEFKIDFLDGFGNLWVGSTNISGSSLPGGPQRPLLYADDLIQLAQWPGTKIEYAFESMANAGKPAVRLSLSLDPASHSTPSEAEKVAERWRLIAYQMMDRHVSIALRCSLNTDVKGAIIAQPLEREKLAKFAQSAYAFYRARSGMKPASFKGDSDTLLKIVRDEMKLPPELALPYVRHLFQPMLNLPLADLFDATSVNVPVTGKDAQAPGVVAPGWKWNSIPQDADNRYLSIAHISHEKLMPDSYIPIKDDPLAVRPIGRSINSIAKELGMESEQFILAAIETYLVVNIRILNHYMRTNIPAFKHGAIKLTGINSWDQINQIRRMEDHLSIMTFGKIILEMRKEQNFRFTSTSNLAKEIIKNLGDLRDFLIYFNHHVERHPFLGGLFRKTCRNDTLYSIAKGCDEFNNENNSNIYSHEKIWSIGALHRMAIDNNYGIDWHNNYGRGWFQSNDPVGHYHPEDTVSHTLGDFLTLKGISLDHFLLVNMTTRLKSRRLLPNTWEFQGDNKNIGIGKIVGDGSTSLGKLIKEKIGIDDAGIDNILKYNETTAGLLDKIVMPVGDIHCGTSAMTFAYQKWFAVQINPGHPDTEAQRYAFLKERPVRAGEAIHLLIPPMPVAFKVDFTPETADPIQPLTVEVDFERSVDMIDPRYPEAARVTSAIPPAIYPNDLGRSLSHFADTLPTAMSAYALAVGHSADGHRRLFTVNRARCGLDGLKIEALNSSQHVSPAPLRLPNKPLRVQVRLLDHARGIFTAKRQTVWLEAEQLNRALHYLVQIVERLTGPDFSGAVHYRNAVALETLLLAKAELAAELASEFSASGASWPASERLKQELRRDLTVITRLNAVRTFDVQCPSEFPQMPQLKRIPSSGTDQPQQAGTPLGQGPAVNLKTLSDDWKVGSTAIAVALADVPDILEFGAVVSYPPGVAPARRVMIEEEQTLRQVLAVIGAPTPEMINWSDLSAIDPLFRPNTRVPVLLGKQKLTRSTTLNELMKATGLSLRDAVNTMRDIRAIFGAQPIETASVDDRKDGKIVATKIPAPPELESQTLQTWYQIANQEQPAFQDIYHFAEAVAAVPMQIEGEQAFIHPSVVDLDEVMKVIELPPSLLADLLADIPGLLMPGTMVGLKADKWKKFHPNDSRSAPTVQLLRTMTLSQLAARIGAPSLADLMTDWNGCLTNPRLFRSGAPIPLRKVTFNNAEIRDGDPAIASAARRNKVPVALVHRQLQGRQPSSTDGLDIYAPVSIPPRAVGQIVTWPRSDRQPVDGGTKLGPFKASLAAGPGTMAAVHGVTPATEFRLGLRVEQIEHAIIDVEDTGGFQASEWLHLMKPIVIPADTPVSWPVRDRKSPGRIRALSQSGTPDEILMRWSYSAEFEVEAVAGDDVAIALHFFPDSGTMLQDKRIGVASALVELLAIAPDIDGLFQALSLPSVPGTKVPDLVATVAELVRHIAKGWRYLREPGAERTTAVNEAVIDVVEAELDRNTGTMAVKLRAVTLPDKVGVEVRPHGGEGGWKPLRGAEPESLLLASEGRFDVRIRKTDLAPAGVQAATATAMTRRRDRTRSMADGADTHGPVGFDNLHVPAIIATSSDVPRADFNAWLAELIRRLCDSPSQILPPELVIYVERMHGRSSDNAKVVRNELVRLPQDIMPATDSDRAKIAAMVHDSVAAAGGRVPAQLSDLRYTVALWSAEAGAGDLPLAQYLDIPFP